MKTGNSGRSVWMACCAFLFAVLAGCGRADLGPPERFGEPVDGGGALPTCGDHKCSPEETRVSCSDDCSCGDGVCSADCKRACGGGVCASGETGANCPQDCPSTPYCGDKACNGTETLSSCPRDCAKCGDGVCSTGEDVNGCPRDCDYCGNGTCGPS